MDKWEEIEYRPIPVRTLLVEMKDLSELMLDLAYSSALFHNAELAKDLLGVSSSQAQPIRSLMQPQT